MKGKVNKMLALRYYDSKMNMTYSLEELRAQYVYDQCETSTFEDWIQEMVENEILIPLV